jgi:glyoxylase-like metal-dependent hydrolase (beta-lactamase superfamily II)
VRHRPATAPLPRRDFVACAAHLALAGLALPAWRRSAPWRPAGRVVAREPFGALERVADGVWALVSTPFAGDRTTLSNGGLVAGRSGVLAVEGFNRPEGARWLAAQARALTGRWPTHVVATHYHGDHANGLAGYRDESPGARPAAHLTAATRDAALRNAPPDAARESALRDAVLVPADRETALDLGGRTVRVVPRAAHTASDLTVHVDDANVAFGGDLLWNAIFPNYVDAAPSRLADAARALRGDGRGVYVPGHGPVARGADVDRYLALLAEVERAARAAHASGRPAADAAAAFALPTALGEWTLFNRAFHERAFAAWYRELGAA